MDIIFLKAQKIFFFSDVLQNYLLFLWANEYIEFFNDTKQIYSWNSKRMSAEIIKNLLDQAILLLQVWLIIILPHGKFLGNSLRVVFQVAFFFIKM